MARERKPRTDMTPVERLQADAAEDYAEAHTPERAAAVREQRGQIQVNGNAAGGRWRGRRS